MIRRLSHAHRPFSLHEFVSVMPNLAIYFLHYLLYTAFVIIQRFLFEKRLRIRMSSHTCAPKGRQAFPTRSRLWCQTQRATKSWLLCQLPCICAAIKKKKKKSEREDRDQRVGSSSHVPVCVLGLFHIPLALLELNCFVGPHQLSPKQRN